MDFKVIGVVGDSIANGYWDNRGGWFYYLQEKLNQMLPYQVGFNQMSQDGDRVCDVFHRMGAEVLTRNIDVLFIAIGVNDIIRPYQPDAAFDMSEHLRAEYWDKLLGLAKKNIETIVVIGLLPVREESYPDTDYADFPIYTFNKDIEEYNRLIQLKCESHGIKFFNPYDEFSKFNLKEIYRDACHPNTVGHKLLAEAVLNFVNSEKILNR